MKNSDILRLDIAEQVARLTDEQLYKLQCEMEDDYPGVDLLDFSRSLTCDKCRELFGQCENDDTINCKDRCIEWYQQEKNN